MEKYSLKEYRTKEKLKDPKTAATSEDEVCIATEIFTDILKPWSCEIKMEFYLNINFVTAKTYEKENV